MPRRRHKNPKRLIHNQIAGRKREARRIEARALFDRQLAKEQAIGIDPKYDHCRGRSEMDRISERRAWLQAEAEYQKGLTT